MAVTPDGQRILSGGRDKTVRVWLLDGTLENTFRRRLVRQTEAVRALVALPDNQHALSGSDDKTVKLFNVNDGAVLRTFKHHTRAVQRALALLPDGAPLRQRLGRQPSRSPVLPRARRRADVLLFQPERPHRSRRVGSRHSGWY